MRTFFSSFLLSLFCATFVAACNDAALTDDPIRGPAGKADLVGSCSVDDCGGQSLDGCWCDEACADFGDCCSDKSLVCDAPVAQQCGGLLGLGCEQGFYCHYEVDAMCGAADQLGQCEPVPQACAQDAAEVCGCDNQTYSNACMAHASGQSVLHDGPCGDDPDQGGQVGESCGGIQDLQCADGLFCDYSLDDICGAADELGTCSVQPTFCIEIFDPVCGCDGEDYTNGCRANAEGIAVAFQGPCATL